MRRAGLRSKVVTIGCDVMLAQFSRNTAFAPVIWSSRGICLYNAVCSFCIPSPFPPLEIPKHGKPPKIMSILCFCVRFNCSFLVSLVMSGKIGAFPKVPSSCLANNTFLACSLISQYKSGVHQSSNPRASANKLECRDNRSFYVFSDNSGKRCGAGRCVSHLKLLLLTCRGERYL